MSGMSRERMRRLVKARRLPVSKRLGVLPDALVDRLVAFHSHNKHDNILSEAIRNRQWRDVPFENGEYLNRHYSQVALQRLRQGGDATVAADFNVAIESNLCDEIRSVTGPACRTRISCLEGSAEIPEHVDDPLQLRAIALLQGEQEFSLQTHAECHHFDMRIGELWFVNTAWPHRVANPGSEMRLALLVDLLDFASIGKYIAAERIDIEHEVL